MGPVRDVLFNFNGYYKSHYLLILLTTTNQIRSSLTNYL